MVNLRSLKKKNVSFLYISAAAFFFSNKVVNDLGEQDEKVH